MAYTYRGSQFDSGQVEVGTDWATVYSATHGEIAGLPVLNLTVANLDVTGGGGALNGARLELLNEGDDADDESAWYALLDSEASGGDEWQDGTIASLIFADAAVKGLAAGSAAHAIARIWAGGRWRLRLKAASTAIVQATGGVKGG